MATSHAAPAGYEVEFDSVGTSAGQKPSVLQYWNVTGPTDARKDWRSQLSSRMAITDGLSVLLAVLIAWGVSHSSWQLPFQTGLGTSGEVSAVLEVGGIAAGWYVALALVDARNKKILATGSAIYGRVLQASLIAFSAVAIISYLFKAEVSRGLVLVSFPVGVLALLLSRRLWRHWLVRKWRGGKFRSRVYLLGNEMAVRAIASRLLADRGSEFEIVGAADARVGPAEPLREIRVGSHVVPIVRYREDVGEHMKELGADSLLVSSGHFDSATQLRNVSWQLEPFSQDLYVAPGMVDVGGPRISVSPVGGLPLLHVDTATMTRSARLIKRTFDLVLSTALIAALSPVLALIAILVALEDRGPVFFRQERVGQGGQSFSMLKFRSMRQDAEQALQSLVEKQERDAGNVVMFKMQDDPRVTKIGKFIRRFSLDELPQLFNVLSGSMSLVGPRPPLGREVEVYEDHVHRKFMVKPGMTGLWQVSGRSNLAWEESVRLDLYYAENWSFVGDLSILLKTFRAVVGSDGAY